MSHSHDHHGHHHHHQSRKSNILFAACLNLAFTIIELIGGLLTNSVAVLSDALHDLGDSLALFGAFVAERQAERPRDKKHTYGYARVSLFSALVTGVLLISGSIFIMVEAVQRFFKPEPIEALWVAGLALFGISTNYLAYRKLHQGHSANEKMLSWHLLEDVLGWVAVLVGALIMYGTGWYIIDALLTIGFTTFILFGVFRNLRDVVDLFLEGVPRGIDIEKVQQSLIAIEGVESVHDMHLWSLDGASHVFTGHIVLASRENVSAPEVYAVVKNTLALYQITHTTIEFEFVDEGVCLGERCD